MAGAAVTHLVLVGIRLSCNEKGVRSAMCRLYNYSSSFSSSHFLRLHTQGVDKRYMI